MRIPPWVPEFKRSSRISPQNSKPIESLFCLTVSTAFLQGFHGERLVATVRGLLVSVRGFLRIRCDPEGSAGPFHNGLTRSRVPALLLLLHSYIKRILLPTAPTMLLQGRFCPQTLTRLHQRPSGTFCDFDTCKCCEMRTNPLLSVTKQLLCSFFILLVCLYVQ